MITERAPAYPSNAEGVIEAVITEIYRQVCVVKVDIVDVESFAVAELADIGTEEECVLWTSSWLV